MDIKQIIDLDLGIDKSKSKEIYNKIQNYILEEIKNKTKEYQNKILDLELNLIIQRELFKAGAKNIKATMALIDFNKLNKKNIDEDIIKDMINKLKTDDETKFLFLEEENTKIKGFKPFETNLNNNITNRNLSYEELCKYYEKSIF